MESSLHEPPEGARSGAQHLCVFVHGLWGNGTHLGYLSKSLQEKYGEDQLVLLVCKRNASSFTYDGIEIGGERVAREIEEALEELKRDGYHINKISCVGYSLGGLIARYAIGLLDQKKYFEHIQPVNFTTFASPHLGVRTPLIGFPNTLWNILGARTLSASGKQLFTVDSFRDTGRPLLSVLADPDSIFIHALAKFQNRSLYTNIVNDRSAVYYTTSISKIDPYVDISKLKINYLPEYKDVMVDPDNPYTIIRDEKLPTFTERVYDRGHTVLRRTPIYLGLSVLLPIAVVVFLINSGIQTIMSRRRIALHEQQSETDDFARYKVSWMVQEARAGLENVFESSNSAQRQQYLPAGSEEMADGEDEEREDTLVDVSESIKDEKPERKPLRRRSTAGSRVSEFPTLALTQAQFAMIRALDAVGFRKYPVHIHNSSHSHAAIIVRTGRKAFREGQEVVRHWIAENFII